jgi:hypothetical protein
VESTNKVLEAILTKTIQLHHRDWVDHGFWRHFGHTDYMEEYNRHTPYELVYGKQVFFPIEFQIKTFRTTTKLGMDLSDAQQQRIAQLNELDEIQ